MACMNFDTRADALEHLRTHAADMRPCAVDQTRTVWVGPDFVSEGEGHSAAPKGQRTRVIAVLQPHNPRWLSGPTALVVGEALELDADEREAVAAFAERTRIDREAIRCNACGHPWRSSRWGGCGNCDGGGARPTAPPQG